jgi:hypothetical protein
VFLTVATGNGQEGTQERCEGGGSSVSDGMGVKNRGFGGPLQRDVGQGGGRCVGVASAGRVGRVTRHTSHVTRHTSHVTRHTSHVTSHTSHVTRHTSHVTRHTSHTTRHTPHVTPAPMHVGVRENEPHVGRIRLGRLLGEAPARPLQAKR